MNFHIPPPFVTAREGWEFYCPCPPNFALFVLLTILDSGSVLWFEDVGCAQQEFIRTRRPNRTEPSILCCGTRGAIERP